MIISTYREMILDLTDECNWFLSDQSPSFIDVRRPVFCCKYFPEVIFTLHQNGMHHIFHKTSIFKRENCPEKIKEKSIQVMKEKTNRKNLKDINNLDALLNLLKVVKCLYQGEKFSNHNIGFLMLSEVVGNLTELKNLIFYPSSLAQNEHRRSELPKISESLTTTGFCTITHLLKGVVYCC